MSEGRPMRVVFLCTHNSARSQMAEALLREDWAGGVRGVEAFSAGVVARGVHPLAVRALEQVTVETGGLCSKTVADLCVDVSATATESAPVLFDVVVTVCDNARDACPFLPASKLNLHRQFPDPSAVVGSEQERLAAFCDVRDQIRRWLADVVPGWLAL